MLDNYTYYEYVDPFSSLGYMQNTVSIDDLKQLTKAKSYDRLAYIEEKVAEKDKKSGSWFKEGVIKNNPISDNTTHTNTSYQDTNTQATNLSDWKGTMMQAYTKALRNKGIDTKYAKYLVAQDALESGWGKHVSGKNNFGGIKGPNNNSDSTLLTTTEYINGKSKQTKSYFRNFDSIDDYVNYKINLLNNDRYHAFDGGNFIDRVVDGGYATSPTYKQKLKEISEQV